MNKGGKIFVLFFFICCSLQAQVNDAALWLGATVEKKLSTRFALELTEELRLNENVTELGTAFTELGATYKIAKGLTGGAFYRYIQRKRVDDFYSMRHRYYLELSYKLKIKKFSLTIRERFQSQYKDVNTSETGLVPSNYLRSKFTLTYNSGKKYKPFIAFELYNQLNNPKGNEIDNIRYQVGLDYELNKFSSLTLSYIINKEVNVNNPWTSYITRIRYKYSF